MQFQEIIQRAKEVREKYHQLEEQNGKVWGKEQIMEGFVKDVGDLMKLVMAKEGWREVEDVDQKMQHELADCLWSVIILADKYQIDLEEAFNKTMDRLDEKIDSKLQGSKQ